VGYPFQDTVLLCLAGPDGIFDGVVLFVYEKEEAIRAARETDRLLKGIGADFLLGRRAHLAEIQERFKPFLIQQHNLFRAP